MGRRRLFIGGALAAVAGISWIVACTGDEAVIPPTTNDGGGGEGGAVDAPAGDSPSNLDGGEGGTTTADACTGTLDTTPCGCAGVSSCCSFTDGGIGCYPAGNGPPECISGPEAYIACVGKANCPPDGLCCAIGTLNGTTCPRRLSHFDTACSPIDAGTGAALCDGKPILCSKQSDCEDYDAGRCEPATMEILGRTMGVCVK